MNHKISWPTILESGRSERGCVLGCRLRFFIDNQTVGDGFTSYKKTQLSVAIPVSSGRHTLRIAKLSDPAKGEAILNSIRLSGGR